jgi:vesicle coat complex subunit
MIKYVDGKKYIFMSHDCKVSYACPKCVAWNTTDLCNILGEYCDNGVFVEDNKYLSKVEPPVSTVNQEQPTLRDQFAMVALNGLLSTNTNVYDITKSVAKASYAFADAMMKERAK